MAAGKRVGMHLIPAIAEEIYEARYCVCWFHSWIPRSKIICSNWELISRFWCLLASWIPRFDFFKAIWEVRSCKCFKIHAQHSLWFLKWHKNYLSGNCFYLRCKYLVKQFPACCFILKNGNSWMKKQLISSKKSEQKNMLGWLQKCSYLFYEKRRASDGKIL